MTLVERWIALGTHEGMAPSDMRRTRLCNLSALIGTFTTFGFGLGFALAGLTEYRPFVILCAINTVVMAMTLTWNTRRYYQFASVWLMFAVNEHIALAALFCGKAVGFHTYFFIFPAVTLLLLPAKTSRIPRFTLILLSVVCYLITEHHPRWATPKLPLPPNILDGMRALSAVLTFVTLGIVVYQFYVDTLRAEDSAAREHERSESLLRNILPDAIATRLKTHNESIADGFAEVSVLFADLVGFTELSSRLPPDELVQLLNRVFSEFDNLTEKRGLEKIKTIGDAYMVAAGLPVPHPDHALRAARFAFDMLAVVERINRDTGHTLALRIGVHSGPVVAGVIGKRKFIYDLWGDTVNVASRMESHGVPGAVQVTAKVAEQIASEFDLSEPRTITVKGKGDMTTHLVLRRRVVTAPNPGGGS